MATFIAGMTKIVEDYTRDEGVSQEVMQHDAQVLTGTSLESWLDLAVHVGRATLDEPDENALLAFATAYVMGLLAGAEAMRFAFTEDQPS